MEASFLDRQVSTRYAQMAEALPMLHFMSVMLFEDDHYDPLLTMKVNFDGEADAFFRRLEAEYGAALRDVVRCSKRPRGVAGAAFDAVTAAGSTAPLAPYLAQCAVTPVTPYRGARGYSRARILCEGGVYLAAQERLGGGESFAGGSAADVHWALRATPRIKALLRDPVPGIDPWRPSRRDRLGLGFAILGF